MTQEQIEAKALELFAVSMIPYYDDNGNYLGDFDENEEPRAAFIKGCQYAATPSVVSGLQWVKASERLPAIKDFDYEVVTISKGHRSVWTIYCKIEAIKLACLFEHSEVDKWLDESSPAQPGYSREQVEGFAEYIGMSRLTYNKKEGGWDQAQDCAWTPTDQLFSEYLVTPFFKIYNK